MTLLLPNKVTIPFCTKAGNSPYNKGGYIGSIEEGRIVDRYKYKEANIVILRPVIDKLIFEYKFLDKNTAKQIQHDVLNNAEHLEAKGICEVADAENVGSSRLNQLNKHYEVNLVLTYKPTNSKIIIQLDPKKKSPRFRCELNPARLGQEGMKLFRAVLDTLLTNHAKKLTSDDIFKMSNAIKRLDVAVDILGVDASDIEGRYVFKNKQLKKHVYKNTTGRLETHYFQMPENDKNQGYWYNKRQELKDNSKDPLLGYKSPYGSALYTRFEYRVNDSELPIARLRILPNHLKKLTFKAADYSRLKNKDYTHSLFLRYALHRTKEKALEIIPESKHKEYAASYDKAIIDIWNPKKIWDSGWIKELQYLGLYYPLPPKKKSKKSK